MAEKIKPPEHKPRLQPTAEFKTNKDRWLAEAIDKMQQDIDWLIQHTVVAHNTAVENENFISGLRSPVKIAGIILMAAAVAYFSAKAERVANPDKPEAEKKEIQK